MIYERHHIERQVRTTYWRCFPIPDTEKHSHTRVVVDRLSNRIECDDLEIFSRLEKRVNVMDD